MAPTFQAAIAESAKNSQYGAAVHVYSPEEYAKMDLYLSPDGKSGFALKRDGDDVDIVSAFSPGGGHVFPMLELAIEQGGNKLDAFDTVLPELYAAAGFREVGRDKWDDKYMPPGWDKKVFGRYNKGEPDIVYMRYDPNYRAVENEGRVPSNVLGITKDEAEAWRAKEKAKVEKARETGKGLDPTARFPEMEAAAKKFADGKITLQQFRNVVMKHSPPPVATKVDKLPTFEQISMALGPKADKSGIIGLNKNIPVGTRLSMRLDVPAYRYYGVWIPTAHELGPATKPGTVIGYAQSAHLNNVSFGTNPGDSMKIAQGHQKYPMSTMDGEWVGTDPAKARRLAESIVSKMDEKGIYKDDKGNEWVQVGMNPIRSSGYYVKGEFGKMELLSSADEVIQVGSVVIARNPVRVPLMITKDKKRIPNPDARELLGLKEGGAALFSLLAAYLMAGSGDDTTGEPEA
jgi:hypothetical protein